VDFSGAGITFVHSNYFYLTGVTSVKNPNANSSIIVFTDIYHHVKWIRKVYNKYRSNVSISDSIKISIIILLLLC